jgi:hypothetical protein
LRESAFPVRLIHHQLLTTLRGSDAIICWLHFAVND